MVKHCSAKELLPIIRDFADAPNTTICSDSFKAYDGLVDFGVKDHYRVKHSKNEFANGRNHINGIENVFISCYTLVIASIMGFAKARLRDFTA